MPTGLLDGQQVFATSSPSPAAPGPGQAFGMNRARLALTSAQILALQTTPLTIVPAPGVGFKHVPLYAIVDFTGGSVAYTNAGGGAVQIVVGTRASALAEGFITTATPNVTHQVTPLAAATSTAANPPTDENAPIQINKLTSNYAAGNGTAIVTVYYTTEAAQPTS